MNQCYESSTSKQMQNKSAESNSLGDHIKDKMKSNNNSESGSDEVLAADQEETMVAGIMMLLGSDGSNNTSNALESQCGQLGKGIASDANAKLKANSSVPEPTRQTSSIASSNSNSGSVTFSLPATVPTPKNHQPSTRSYGSASSGSLSSSGGEQRKRPALKVHSNLSTNMNANRISGGNTSSNNGSNASGSGSDGGGNNTSSTSNNPMVTAGSATAANSNNSSGSGSDGGSGSGSGNNRQSGGEASNEYYYAGYGSGSLATNGSLQPHGNGVGHHHHRHQEVTGMPDMPSFAAFRGSSLEAASAEMDLNRNDGNLPPPPPALLGPEGMTRHVLVAADDASNPPNIAYAQSHLRHHSRHIHHRRVAPTPASQDPDPNGGIPSTIGPANQHNVRLPPEENALQRPQAQREQHVTVMANHGIPPPQTSSDVWSSGSSSLSVARGGLRKRPAAAAPTSPTRSPAGSVSNNSRSSSAVHVSTDDPILKPSMFSHSPQKKVAIKSNSPQVQPLKTPESTEPSKPAAEDAKSKSAGIKRKAYMLRSLDDSSDGARSDFDAGGSGSEEGYEASSSSNAERQSGSSGSDSVSSDDANKNKVAKTRNNASASSPGKKTASIESQSGKRTETSSMSSSVLADFSSGVNEELNSFSSSPNSSCVSLNDLDDVKGRNEAAKAKSDSNAAANNEGIEPMETEPTARSHRKRSHHETERKDTDIDMISAPDATMKSGLALVEKSLQQKVRSAHHYHSRSTGRKMLEESFLSAKRNLSSGSSPDDAKVVTASALESTTSSVSASGSAALSKEKVGDILTNSAHRPMKEVSFQDTLIYSLGADVMALVVSFLEVPESHTFLTSPLSKTWLEAYTVPQELWKILCTSKPFYAKLEENPDGSSDISTCSFPLCNDIEIRHLFGRYRLLYSSFVRCVKYLDRLRDDAINGRTPSVYNDSSINHPDLLPYNRNGSLKAYFARARRLVRRNARTGSPSSSSASGSLTTDSGEEQKADEKMPAAEAAAASSGSENSSSSQQTSQPRLGRSMLTERLLRPTRAGEVDHVNLPWSCAIYSVVNWMVAFVDVEGIQVSHLK
jgi:hypothetical protein